MEGKAQAQHSAVVGPQPRSGAVQCLSHAVTCPKAETVTVPSDLHSTFLDLGALQYA